jgi:AraC-like DNA-binding protein
MQKRIEKAKRLLLTTDCAINKIALMVGFNNKSFFYKMFYKFYGTTPMQCRKTNGKSICQRVKKDEE